MEPLKKFTDSPILMWSKTIKRILSASQDIDSDKIMIRHAAMESVEHRSEKSVIRVYHLNLRRVYLSLIVNLDVRGAMERLSTFSYPKVCVGRVDWHKAQLCVTALRQKHRTVRLSRNT